MNKALKYGVLALGLGTSTLAHASTVTAVPGENGILGGILDFIHPPPVIQKSGKLAPEVDPGMAISGFALLAGSLLVFRARRPRRSIGVGTHESSAQKA